ncbi:MAG: hypothetical protein M1817_006856 [Caeruleum heppii]|nr:MAG: hypothetical protein M1817_006856 [Caeruleum heppii]
MKVVMEPHEASARHIVFGAEEARERFLTPDAIGAVQYEAGSISAYRFTTGVLKLALEKGLNLQTTTPATKIRYRAEVSSNEGRWVIDTPRGGISTEQVVLATNGYSASLWPQVQGVIVPMRGQITAQRPGESMPSSGLGKTYSFIHGDGYDYMVPQPAGSRYPNDLVVGGGLRYAANEGLYEYGETDDTVHNKDISEYLTDSLVDFFGVNWGRDDLDGRIRKEWTGIMGYSPDGHPLVGEMPGQRGLYISAAFNGNGMTLCLLCAKALKDMMLGHDKRELDSWFPKPYRVSQDRLQMRYAGKPKLVQGEALEVRANT